MTMDYDLGDNEGGFDSDYIDEDIEHRLYASVFFEHPIEVNPAALVTGENVVIQPSVNPNYGSFTDESFTLEASTDHKIVSKTDIPARAVISSFQDQSSSESGQFTVDPKPSISAAGSTSESSDCGLTEYDSMESPFMPQLNCTASSGWNHEHVVLGTVSHFTSGISSLKDRLAIARLLDSKRNDPKLWTIDPDDYTVSHSGPRDSRYFKDEYEVCSKCKNRGHTAFVCEGPGPVCIYCGNLGHLKSDCPTVYCFACLSPGHSKKQCDLLNHLKQCTCARCGLKGHESRLCTELWRQYRNTTRVGKPVPISPKMVVQPRGCCNCGRRGHTVDDCKCKPLRSNFIGPLPRRRVFVYDKNDIYKKKTLKSLCASERKRFRRLVKRYNLTNVNHTMSDLQDPHLVNAHKNVNDHLLQVITGKGKMKQNITSSGKSPNGDDNQSEIGLSPLDRIKFRRASSTNEDIFVPLKQQNARRPKRKKMQRRNHSVQSRNHENSFFSLLWEYKANKMDEQPENLGKSSFVPETKDASLINGSVPRKCGKRKLGPARARFSSHSNSGKRQRDDPSLPFDSNQNTDELATGSSNRPKQLSNSPKTYSSSDQSKNHKKRKKNGKQVELESAVDTKQFTSDRDTDWMRFIRSPLNIESWERTPQKKKPNKKARKSGNRTLLAC